jgi:predicted PurR-regulated permease PerM
MNNKTILIIALTAVFGFVIYRLGSSVIPFILSFVIAYFLHPLVRYFTSEKISKSMVVLLIMTLILGIFTLAIVLIFPIIIEQSGQMMSNIPEYYEKFKAEVYPKYLSALTDVGIVPSNFFDNILQEQEIVKFVKKFSFQIFDSSLSLVNFFSFIFIMPILIFYILKDWDSLVKNFNDLLPKSSISGAHKILKEIDLALSGYARGQAIVCLIMAFVYVILLSITGLNYGFLIGLFTGIFAFIPYVGAFLGFIAVIIVALFQWGLDPLHLSMVILAIILGQILESNFLTPKLIGNKVGLHPVWVIFGIFIFGALFGFIGVIFSVPLTAVGGVLIKNLAKEYKKRMS